MNWRTIKLKRLKSVSQGYIDGIEHENFMHMLQVQEIMHETAMKATIRASELARNPPSYGKVTYAADKPRRWFS